MDAVEDFQKRVQTAIDDAVNAPEIAKVGKSAKAVHHVKTSGYEER